SPFSVAQINSHLSLPVEASNEARVRLAALVEDLLQNLVELVQARRTLHRAQTRLERRIVLIYTSEQPTALDILLGASSLGDLVDELDVARKIAAQDDEIAREAAAAKADLERRRAQLERERRAQRQTVARLAVTRTRIES